MTTPTVVAVARPVAGRAWTSTRTAWAPSLSCAAATLLWAAIIARASDASVRETCWLGGILGVLVAIGTILGSRVLVTVNAREVSWRHGLGHVRHVPWEAVRHLDQQWAGHGGLVGIGLRPHRFQSRRVVGSGPVLHLELTSGEHIWLSTRCRLPAVLASPSHTSLHHPTASPPTPSPRTPSPSTQGDLS